MRKLLSAIALAGVSIAASAPAAPAPYQMIGQQAPAFSAPLAGGGVLTEASLKGKWTVVEFWGLWCEDSMADLKHAEALARAIAQDPHLAFVTVHVDQRYGRWASVEDFQSEEGARYPVALDPRRELMRAFQVTSTPTYLVIDPRGAIRAVHYDLRKDRAPEGGVKALMRQIAELQAIDRALPR